MSRYTYTAYGLNFEASFPLPELLPAQLGAPDITIRYGDVPDSLPQASTKGIGWQASPGQMLIVVVDVARYLVVEDHEIRIQPLPGGTESDVRTFLLGSVLGALLHARRMLVLHASVIQTDRGAVVFMGKSGAGKSTLLGAFLQRDYHMLSDDKAGVVLDERGQPQIMPGLPFIRLTPDAALKLNYPVQESQMRTGLRKYVVPVNHFHSGPAPFRSAYFLGAHKKPEIHLERLEALDRFHALNRNTYRRRLLKAMDGTGTHFQILKTASSFVKVVRVLRPDHPILIDELRARIEEDMEVPE